MTQSREIIQKIIEDLEYKVSIHSHNGYRRELLRILIKRAKEELAQCN